MVRFGGASISAARRLLSRRSHSAPKMIAASPATISTMRPMLHGSTCSACHTVALWPGARCSATNFRPMRALKPQSRAAVSKGPQWSEIRQPGAAATVLEKEAVMPYENWIDRQIREAIERGEFDNLPGQGKPIKGLNGRDDENWWVKAYLEREQLPLPLPTALALRREVAALQETLADVADEESAREIVRDLNHRIAESHRIRVDGPPIVIGRVNVEHAVADWRRRRRSA